VSNRVVAGALDNPKGWQYTSMVRQDIFGNIYCKGFSTWFFDYYINLMTINMIKINSKTKFKCVGNCRLDLR